jgi:uncharacterized protein DUF4920
MRAIARVFATLISAEPAFAGLTSEERALARPALTPRLLALGALVLAGIGCESGAPSSASRTAANEPTPPAPPAAAAAPTGAVHRYGATIEPASSVPLATLLANPKAYTAQTVTTEGKVQRACSRKGCWMEIGEGDSACRVTFKDYAFFVPTDSAGAHAKIQGKLDTREVEAAAVAHLESEGARFNHKNADGSAVEVRMIASAVELVR